MEIDSKLFKIAYKKLKSSLYYDKTQIILRDKLVKFEANIPDIDKYLEELADIFMDLEKREELIKEILSTISYYSFPKNLIPEDDSIIKNYSLTNIEVKDNQYFIDMDIRGHILGVLWILLIGYRLDKNIYKFSYGNRIREKLYNELNDEPTYSPYLFEPYFQQYESWRDNAMDQALQNVHSGHDVVILTLDFKRFYYSVDISEDLMHEIYNNIIVERKEDENEILRVINDFVYQVIFNYARLFDEFNGFKILPIGFLPSNVLANYALRNFDQAILDGWNPLYYGRYVDDIIIVDKIVNNSDLYKQTLSSNLKWENIIQYFLKQCSGWKGLNGINCKKGKTYALFKDDIDELGHSILVLNKEYNPVRGDCSKIVVQDKKVKVFYFKSGESDALITCFKESIAKNKSEFRHMPEDEAVFQKDDYSEIYDLKNDETINKFRGITGISVNKFELSKLLGKYLRIGGLITDTEEAKFDVQITKIFTQRVIIENYTVWEKVIEILAINESFAILQEFVDCIIKSIDMICYENQDILKNEKRTLYLFLHSAICRSLALVWGEKPDELISNLCSRYVSREGKSTYITHEIINSQRKAYCKTRMIDKSVMPIFIDMLRIEKIFESTENVNFTNFAQMKRFCKKKWISKYFYYPFLVTMYDFSMIACIEELKKQDHSFSNLENIYNMQMENYIKSNYRVLNCIHNLKQIIKVNKFQSEIVTDKQSYIVSVDNGKKDKLRLAIANVKLNHDNFEKVVKENPNRSYRRYRDVSKLINEAIDEHADMLIMPESFMPFEWLSTVARTCARNNLALVTGIEHVKINNKIFNLTAVILPYDDLINKSAYVSFHLKTHYAPAEKQEINGYRLGEMEGSHYELYKWSDSYFPVYCCYELTSIIERAMFQSYADFLVAIEWNSDVNYYSNILESLSRDIHCYCIQVNSSDYGDSRITKPSKTEEKDIIRTKGGINNTILVDEIDIGKMRDFQLKGYELQAIDKRYKPTPPGFDPDIVFKKIKGDNLLKEQTE